MDLAVEILKWSAGLVAALIVVYVGVRMRAIGTARKDHLERTRKLEINFGRHSAEVSNALKNLITTQHSQTNTITTVAESVARIEGELKARGDLGA